MRERVCAFAPWRAMRQRLRAGGAGAAHCACRGACAPRVFADIIAIDIFSFILLIFGLRLFFADVFLMLPSPLRHADYFMPCHSFSPPAIIAFAGFAMLSLILISPRLLLLALSA